MAVKVNRPLFFLIHQLPFEGALPCLVVLALCLSVCILCFCFSYCIHIVLLSAQWGGSSGIEAQSLGLLFLQCFDTVGWVF